MDHRPGPRYGFSMNDRGEAGAGRPVLFVGDIHLGRRPPALEAVCEAVGLGTHEISATAAWRAAVDYATTHGVRAVVLAGDVVESEDDRFEAFGHLQAGARTLVEAGIPVIAVAGNHDAVALPLLTERIPEVTLLGAGGHWECRPLPGEGPAIDLLGWSFPGRRVTQDPTLNPGFEAARASHRSGAHLIGVVHGDLDAPGSAYAPLDSHRLRDTPAEAWLLGHIHRPDALAPPRPFGYLGSLGALDAGEPGIHGPWEFTTGPHGPVLRQVPLSPIRFENLEVELDDAAAGDADTVMDTIRGTADATFGGQIANAQRWLKLLVLRVTLTGRVESRHGIADAITRHDPADFFDLGGIPCTLARIADSPHPPVDLEALARDTSPAGEIARLIRTLERGGIPDDLAVRANAVIETWSTGTWDVQSVDPLPDTAQLLLDAAWRALGALIEQKREDR